MGRFRSWSGISVLVHQGLDGWVGHVHSKPSDVVPDSHNETPHSGRVPLDQSSIECCTGIRDGSIPSIPEVGDRRVLRQILSDVGQMVNGSDVECNKILLIPYPRIEQKMGCVGYTSGE